MSDFIEVEMVLEKDMHGRMATIAFKIRPEIVTMYSGSHDDPNTTLIWFDPEGHSRIIAEPVDEFEEKLRISQF